MGMLKIQYWIYANDTRGRWKWCKLTGKLCFCSSYEKTMAVLARIGTVFSWSELPNRKLPASWFEPGSAVPLYIFFGICLTVFTHAIALGIYVGIPPVVSTSFYAWDEGNSMTPWVIPSGAASPTSLTAHLEFPRNAGQGSPLLFFPSSCLVCFFILSSRFQNFLQE